MLKASGIRVHMAKLYADDLRFILDLIAKGWRWDFRKEWELEDSHLNLMDHERVA